MRLTALIIIAGVGTTLPAIAGIVDAPKLTLSCLQLHENSDMSVDLGCSVQNTATEVQSVAPVIKGVQIQLNNFATGGVEFFLIGDLSPAQIGKTTLHFPPNIYTGEDLGFVALGVANDALFGNVYPLGAPP